MIVNVPDVADDRFMIGLVAVLSLEFALFAGCALLSLKFYAERRAIEPESTIAFRLGAALLTAHVFHVMFLLLAVILA